MANLTDDSEEGVSLFPMFNILACTLGVMVFVLTTVATVSLGADKAVEMVVDAEGVATGLRPMWLEWDGSELALHPDGDRARFDRDLRAFPTFESTHQYMFSALAGNSLGAKLAQASLDRDRLVVVLVRPSGFADLEEIRSYLELLGMDPVLEPIDQDWQRIQVR